VMDLCVLETLEFCVLEFRSVHCCKAGVIWKPRPKVNNLYIAGLRVTKADERMRVC
jgi:hypothetical protein